MFCNYDFLEFNLEGAQQKKLCISALTVAKMYLDRAHDLPLLVVSVKSPCPGVVDVTLEVATFQAQVDSHDDSIKKIVVTFFDGNALAGLPGWSAEAPWQPHLVKVHTFHPNRDCSQEGFDHSWKDLPRLTVFKLFNRHACRGNLRIHREFSERYQVVLEGTPEFRQIPQNELLPEYFPFVGFHEWVEAHKGAAALIEVRTLESRIQASRKTLENFGIST